MSRLLHLRNAGRVNKSRAATLPTNVSASCGKSFNSTNPAFRLNSYRGNASVNSNVNANINANAIGRNDKFAQTRFHTTNMRNRTDRNLTAAQMNLNLFRMHAEVHSGGNGSGIPSLSEVTAWILHKTKVPKG